MKNKYLKITVVLLLFCGISSAQMPISKEQYYKLNQTVYAIKELSERLRSGFPPARK